MGTEHKGLRANFLNFKKNMDALNSAIQKGNEIAPAMAADITSMVEQVSSYQDDLKFMSEVLGNGSGATSEPPPPPPPVTTIPPVALSPMPATQPADAAPPANTIDPGTHTRDSNGNVIER